MSTCRTTEYTGTVVFTNLDGVVTVIPAGIGMRTTSGSPVRFRTIQTVSMDPRLGATVVDEQKVPGLSWTVLADPAGNVFCVGQFGE